MSSGNPALNLLLSISPYPLTDALRMKIDALLNDSIDWGEFLFWVRRHAVNGVVLANMQAIGQDRFPEFVFQQIKRNQYQAGLHNMALLGLLSQVSALFEGHQIDFSLLKGPLLSQVLYNSYTLRTSVDLDLLVAPCDFNRADAVLQEAQYKLYEPPDGLTPFQARFYPLYRHHYSYRSPGNGIGLELHWSLAEPYYLDTKLSQRWMARGIQAKTTRLEVRTLSSEDYLAYAFMHGAKHRWSSVKFLLDIFAILRQSHNLNWEQVLSSIHEARLERVVAQGMGLLQTLWQVDVPPALQPFLKQEPSTRFLTHFSLEALTWRKTEKRGDLRWFLYGYLLKPTLAYRFHYLSRALFSPFWPKDSKPD